jgi:hypothetical protein
MAADMALWPLQGEIGRRTSVINMRDFEELFAGLSKSAFRSRFKLGTKEAEYLLARGLDVIALQARDFVNKRLAPANPANDGKQTPMRNHPVFIAQHATATCCRKCLQKWHGIPQGIALTDTQVDYIVSVIVRWLQKQNQDNLA